jgi:hypothetical protein
VRRQVTKISGCSYFVTSNMREPLDDSQHRVIPDLKD